MYQRDALEELASDLQIQACELYTWDSKSTLPWFQACAQVLRALKPAQRESQLSTFAIVACARLTATDNHNVSTSNIAALLRTMMVYGGDRWETL